MSTAVVALFIFLGCWLIGVENIVYRPVPHPSVATEEGSGKASQIGLTNRAVQRFGKSLLMLTMSQDDMNYPDLEYEHIYNVRDQTLLFLKCARRPRDWPRRC